MLQSCDTPTTVNTNSASNSGNTVDTLLLFDLDFTKDFSPVGFKPSISKKGVSKAYPINEWVEWNILWREERNKLVENSTLFVESKSDHVQVKMKNNNTFYLNIDSLYLTEASDLNTPDESMAKITIGIGIKPKDGFVIKSKHRSAPFLPSDELVFTWFTREIHWKK